MAYRDSAHVKRVSAHIKIPTGSKSHTVTFNLPIIILCLLLLLLYLLKDNNDAYVGAFGHSTRPCALSLFIGQLSDQWEPAGGKLPENRSPADR